MDYPQRVPLLNRRGEVENTGWAKEDIFIYNKEKLHSPKKSGEWEFYRLLGNGFALRVAYGHTGPLGLVSAVLSDYDTGENFRLERVFPHAGDRLDLDFTGDDVHTVKYEEEDFLFCLDYNGTIRRLRFRSADLDAELTAHNEGEALAVLQSYPRRGQFQYSFQRCFLDLAGEINFRNQEYTPDTDSFLMLQSIRNQAPFRSRQVCGGGAMNLNGHLLGLSFSYESDDAEGPTANCLFWDDRVQKLGRVYAKMRPENLLASWHIYDDADRIHLDFEPEAIDVPRSRLPAKTPGGKVYGTATGSIRLESGRTVQVQDMRFYGEYARSRG